MADAARHIVIEKSSELGRVLDEARATGQPVVIDVDGCSYRLTPQPQAPDELWKDYDPDKVLAALQQTAGSWADLDADKLVADIYMAREEGSRPPHRP